LLLIADGVNLGKGSRELSLFPRTDFISIDTILFAKIKYEDKCLFFFFATFAVRKKKE
jgi:hypothetical protein